MSGGRRNEAGALEIGAGLVTWVIYAVWSVPSMLSEAWAQALIVFAALVLLPLAWPLVVAGPESGASGAARRTVRVLQMPAALLLAWAFRVPQGLAAASLALPWCLVLVLQAFVGLRRLGVGLREPAGFIGNVGLAYGAIGAAWTLSDRLGFRPLGFDPVIVLLTAAHFHVAGVVLPIVTGRVCAVIRRRGVAAVLAYGAALGVILVAIGITASRYGLSPAVEAVAAVALSVAAIGVALVQLRLAFSSEYSMGAQTCFGLSGLSLLAGMGLASLYGLRSVAMPLPWLDIAWMRALHGSVNAIGFSFFGVLGWRLAIKSSPPGRRPV